MKAILLVGGKGTRLASITGDKPKALVDIHGVPLLGHQLLLLKSFGITDIILSVGHKADMIMEHFGSGKEYGVSIKYAIETEPLGTAGAIKNCENLLDGKPFMAMNGDLIHRMNLDRMLMRFKKTNPLAMIAVRSVEDARDLGVVMVEYKTNKIKAFLEKPENPPSNLINAGVYVMQHQILELIPSKKFSMIEYDIFPKHATECEAFVTTAYWSDVGTPERYFQTLNDLKP